MISEHFDDLFLRGVCSGRVDKYKYLRDWIAYAARFPHRAMATTLLVRGPRGSGKTTVARSIAAIVGGDHVVYSHPEHLSLRFNDQLRGATTLVVDETTPPDGTELDHRSWCALRALICDSVLVTERRGEDPVLQPNLLRIVLTTSSRDWPTGDLVLARRLAVFDLSPDAVLALGETLGRTLLDPRPGNYYPQQFRDALALRGLDGFTAAEVPA